MSSRRTKSNANHSSRYGATRPQSGNTNDMVQHEIDIIEISDDSESEQVPSHKAKPSSKPVQQKKALIPGRSKPKPLLKKAEHPQENIELVASSDEETDRPQEEETDKEAERKRPRKVNRPTTYQVEPSPKRQKIASESDISPEKSTRRKSLGRQQRSRPTIESEVPTDEKTVQSAIRMKAKEKKSSEDERKSRKIQPTNSFAPQANLSNLMIDNRTAENGHMNDGNDRMQEAFANYNSASAFQGYRDASKPGIKRSKTKQLMEKGDVSSLLEPMMREIAGFRQSFTNPNVPVQQNEVDSMRENFQALNRNVPVKLLINPGTTSRENSHSTPNFDSFSWHVHDRMVATNVHPFNLPLDEFHNLAHTNAAKKAAQRQPQMSEELRSTFRTALTDPESGPEEIVLADARAKLQGTRNFVYGIALKERMTKLRAAVVRTEQQPSSIIEQADASVQEAEQELVEAQKIWEQEVDRVTRAKQALSAITGRAAPDFHNPDAQEDAERRTAMLNDITTMIENHQAQASSGVAQAQRERPPSGKNKVKRGFNE